jgi:S1-C subfamily serine protease
MNWENVVVKINVKSNEVDFNSPLNIRNIISSSGTGFFITKNLILTCYHVVKYALDIEIIYKQTILLRGQIKYIFPDDDLAIVSLNTFIEDANILDFKIINNKKKLNEVYTIGFPSGSDNIINTKGIISGFRQSKIQIDATLNSGNSGGPLVLNDNETWYYIGINVSKLTNAENTGFCIPIYRFIVSLNYILKHNIKDIIIYKPCCFFEYQNIKQEELKQEKFINYPELIDKNIGVIITILNKQSYLSRYFNIEDVLLSINDSIIDYNGYIKFDFYPDKISISNINLWFMMNNILKIKVLKNSDKKIHTIYVKLEYTKKNLFNYYLLDNFPKYYIENNNLVLSVITKDHIDNLTNLNLSLQQVLQIASRFLYKQDLFTIYLADVNPLIFKKYNKYPIGDIIIEINDKSFNNYDEFINITKEKINKIKTINNQVFYV